MIEIEKFNGSWKVVPTAIPYPLSNDAIAILLHLIGKSKGKAKFMPDEPIAISKNELKKLTDKCWKKIDDSIQELIDFNFISEFKYQPKAPSCIIINWEEIWELQQVISKISTLGRIELRKMMRENGPIAFSKLPKNDIDELLNKYTYNSYDKAGEEANGVGLPYNQRLEPSNLGLEAYNQRLEGSHRRLEAYVLGLEAYNQRLEASNDLSYVLDKFSQLIHDVCEKDVELAKITQNSIISCVEKLSGLITTDHKLITSGEKLITTDYKTEPDLITSGENSNKYIEINKEKNEITSVSELYKGENKEKVEEVEGDRKLPDNNKNSLDSFLENSLGESSSINQETSSEKNNLDQEQSEETFQEEEIKVLEIPDCEKFRDSSFPVYSQVEIERILDEHFQPESEIELAIREIWNELTQVEEDEDPVEVIPVNQFGRNLQNYIEDKTAADPEYPVTLQDLFNTFAFEYFLDDGMWLYKVSSSSIRNIQGKAKETQEEISSEEHEAEKNSRRRNDSVSRDCYFEAIQEVGDEDSEQLSDMEYVVYQLFSAINGPELTSIFPGSRMVDGRAICIKDIFWDKIDEWSEEANLERKDVDWMFKKFKQENKMLIIQPTKIKYQKILEWNHRYHAVKNSAELLWQQKMAELQN